MTRQQLVRPLLLFAAIAALLQVPKALAFEYLGSEIRQNAWVSVRDYVYNYFGDPGYSSVSRISSKVFGGSGGANSLTADVTRTGHDGLTGAALSQSFAEFHLNSRSGYARIDQTAIGRGYYVDRDFPQSDDFGEANASAGGDSIRIRFRVDATDGEIVFRGQSSWANKTDANSYVHFPERAYITLVAPNGLQVGSYFGLPLYTGEWTILVEKTGVGLNGNGTTGSAEASAQFAASWTFDAIWPGQTPARPLLAYAAEDEEATDGDDEPPPAGNPINITGPKLTFPVREGIGHTGSAFVGLPTQVPGGSSKGALVTGFEVTSEYSPLTSFVVPALPPGAAGLTIDTGAGPHSVVAGETINFGPAGLASFSLAGFDPMLASAELDAFVFGLQFAEEGLASLTAIPTLFIPPGDHNENGVVDAADYVKWRKTGGSPDGYNLWRANLGQPAAAGASAAGDSPIPAAVPERTADVYGGWFVSPARPRRIKSSINALAIATRHLGVSTRLLRGQKHSLDISTLSTLY